MQLKLMNSPCNFPYPYRYSKQNRVLTSVRSIADRAERSDNTFDTMYEYLVGQFRAMTQWH